MHTQLRAFADPWVSDWNSHDRDAILSHYARDVTFRSPKVSRYTQGQTDILKGRDNLRLYFSAGLKLRPKLYFFPTAICVDADGLALVYAGEDATTVVETMTLDEDGKVSAARVFYNPRIGLEV